MPLLLLAMTGGIFVIDPDEKADRLTLTATIFLVLIAYKFSIASTLPRVPYHTELDRYMSFCEVSAAHPVEMAWHTRIWSLRHLEVTVTSFLRDRWRAG